MRRNPLKSRKFLMACISMLVILLNQLFGVKLSAEVIAAIVLPIVVYILGESYVDSRK